MSNLLPQSETLSLSDPLKAWARSPIEHWIGNSWESGPHRFDNYCPSSGQKWCEVSEADAHMVDRAVNVARQAFELGGIRSWSITKRTALLREIADVLDANRRDLAILESIDTGKPIQESFHGDIPRAAQNFRFFADLGERQESMVITKDSFRHECWREPVGVVGLIVPWNLPLYLATWKIAPALLMGNSVVLKPSELTPLTATYFAKLISELKIPSGVFNLVHGGGAKSTGEFLVSHSGVDAISFTGETHTGKAIMANCAKNLTRVSFELGGKGAAIICEDADLDLAVDGCARGGFRNQGEICLATPRIYVHRKRIEEFRERFVKRIQNLTVGDPLHTETQFGALISSEHLKKVAGFVESAKGAGKILVGGKQIDRAGYYFQPTVIEDLPDSHPLVCSEVFGPVVSLHAFEDHHEVIERVNNVEYGLSASVWSQSVDRINDLVRSIRTGLIWSNCWFVRDLNVPFGGMKKSGIGREGGQWSLDFYGEWKSTCRNLSAEGNA